MSDAAIVVEGLGKMYRISKAVQRPANAREALVRGLASPFDYLKRKMQGPSEDEILWALKDVSFEVKEGEVLGIIGRNGAGKSTLLKILSRITEPTTGHAEIRGRVNSLLEVGTGFHPELTGRENIYMNAAMHGMKRREINAKLDEIIAFAEVEKFIDTPVKRYSSGMYTRLAFAVAAHLEPDILIVDEVLAVGDAAFQKKCLGKMQDVAGQGRTVLFVSHQMAAVASLCKSCILLEKGENRRRGDPSEVIAEYMNAGATECSNSVSLVGHPGRLPGMKPLLTRFEINLAPGNILHFGQKLEIAIHYDFPFPIADPQFTVGIYTSTGPLAFTLISDYQSNNIPSSLQGSGVVFCRTKPIHLLPGHYTLGLRLWQPGEKHDDVEGILSFTVEWLNREIGQFNWNAGLGVVYVDARWQMEPIQ